MARRRSNACSNWTLRSGPRRSAIAADFAEKRPQRTAHHVADRCSFGRRPRPDRVHQAGRQLERHRRRRLDNRHRSAHQLGLLDVSVCLTARHCELARQRQGSLPHALPPREQPVSRIETFRLLRIGRSRHLPYKYYLLRRKSSTQRERSSPITRSKQKLPFAFGECSHHYWRTCTCAGLCWGGRSSALSKALVLASSLMRMTSWSCAEGVARRTHCIICARSWAS